MMTKGERTVKGLAMSRNSMKFNRLTLPIAFMTVIGGCSTKSDAITIAEKIEKDRPGIAETTAIAEEGFIYGLPLVMSYGIMNAYSINRDSGAFTAPLNQILNEPRVYTPKDRAIPLPNSDTPYSILFVDLRAEPIVLSLPAVEKRRYYSVMLSDLNTFNYGYMGSRTTGNAPGDYMVVGPDWQGETPKGIKKVFRSSTWFSLAAYRTQLLSANDMGNVEKVQSGYKVQTLSAYLKQPAPPAAPVINFPAINKELIKTNFFEYLDFALQFAPPAPDEQAVRAKLARIGIGAGKTFDFKDLSLEHKAGVLLGMKEGETKVDEAIKNFGKDINGWNVAAIFGDSAFYNGDWLKRAAAAKFGIFGNSAEEALYPFVTKDANGEALDGSKHNYTLTFAANELPPVKAFWSLTMYDPKTQQLIENPINRYLLNSEMLPNMKKNPDGSLTLIIQKDSPGKVKEANWLPAPDGPIYMLLRLYVPTETPPSILPAGEGTWKPPAVMQAK
jgi:hypothetical protein